MRGSISVDLGGLTSSLALVNAPSRSSAGFQTLGTPASSYLNRSSKEDRRMDMRLASLDCSSSFRLSESHVRDRSTSIAFSFSSSVQPKLFALPRYDDSAAELTSWYVLRTVSHISGFGLLSATSTGSRSCFLTPRSIALTIFFVSSALDWSAMCLRSSSSRASSCSYSQSVSCTLTSGN